MNDKEYREFMVLEARNREKKLRTENAELKARWEKLKVATTGIYHKLDHHDVWGRSGDTVCDNCEDFVHKKMQELESGKAKKEGKT